jgi:hypothetical protein
MSWHALVNQGTVAAAVAAVAIGIYDLQVRQPNTPRLAVVDVPSLYAAAQQRATRAALVGPNSAQPGSAGATADTASNSAAEAGAAGRALMQNAETFGPTLDKTLRQLAVDCDCTLVGMAAVFGAHATMPDYTAEAARRLGLELTP